MSEDHLESLLRCWSVDDCESMPEKTVELIKVAAERLDDAEARVVELERELQIVEGALEMAQGEMGLALYKYAEAQSDGLERAAELVEATPGQMRPDDEPFDQGTANDIAAAIRALKAGSHG